MGRRWESVNKGGSKWERVKVGRKRGVVKGGRKGQGLEVEKMRRV
jgi:hypothetical protein